MKNPISKAGVINGISKVYGVLHVAAAIIPEAIVELEVLTVKSISKGYDSNRVRAMRYKNTEEVHDKIKDIPKLTYNKFRLVTERAKSSVKDSVVYEPQNQPS